MINQKRLKRKESNSSSFRKYATLAPYLSEIEVKNVIFLQKKKKILLKLQKNKKFHQSSQKSFRIKSKNSATSLHHKQTIEQKIKIIDVLHTAENEANNHHKIEKKMNLDESLEKRWKRISNIEIKKKKHLSLQFEKKTTKNTRQINFFRRNKKYFENSDEKLLGQKKVTKIEQNQKRVEEKEKKREKGRKNFRQKKYEQISQTLNIKKNQKGNQQQKQLMQSLNEQIDIQIKKEGEKQNKKWKFLSLKSNVQRSTDRYFQISNQKNSKSNNEIQAYMNLIKHPCKKSEKNYQNENEEQNENNKKQENRLFEYKFDFEENDEIVQLEEQNYGFQEGCQFEEQRKEVEKEYLKKHMFSVDSEIRFSTSFS